MGGGESTQVVDVLYKRVFDFANQAGIELADRALSSAGLLTGGARADVLLLKAARLELLGLHEEQRACLAEALR